MIINEELIMNVRYSDQPAFTAEEGHGIFLAGPTPRKKEVPSWRPSAVAILEKLGYKGTVLVPEREDWTIKFAYEDQVDWEHAGLLNAKAIVIWVPRDMETMPALTTNVEFGYWLAKSPEKIVYGRPPSAPSTRYLDWLYRKDTNRVVFDTLEATLKQAMSL